MFKEIVNYILELVEGLGYIGIFLLMTIESSFIPFPSEVVLIPAGYLVKKGDMNMLMVILAGIGGSLLGAYINYFLSRTLGRKFILKFGHYFLLPEQQFLRIESWFLKHSVFATFVGRLIFGVRQWISVPAGLAKMPLGIFSVLTALGAGIWVVILVLLGYLLGKGEDTVHQAKLIGMWLLGVVVIMSFAYYHWCAAKKRSADQK